MTNFIIFFTLSHIHTPHTHTLSLSISIILFIEHFKWWLGRDFSSNQQRTVEIKRKEPKVLERGLRSLSRTLQLLLSTPRDYSVSISISRYLQLITRILTVDGSVLVMFSTVFEWFISNFRTYHYITVDWNVFFFQNKEGTLYSPIELLYLIPSFHSIAYELLAALLIS
jgi:hypothetical protein